MGLVPLSLDAVVLRSPWGQHDIDCGCRSETAAGHFQNLIRRTGVVFDENFLSARQLAGVRLRLECLGRCRRSTSTAATDRNYDQELGGPGAHESAYAPDGPVSPWKSMWRHARATALAGPRRIAPGHWTSDSNPFGEGIRGNSVAKSQQKQFVHSVTYVTDHPSPADYSQGELSEGDDGR